MEEKKIYDQQVVVSILFYFIKLLAYTGAYVSNELIFKKSNMILCMVSDAWYILITLRKSLCGGFAHLFNDNEDLNETNRAIYSTSDLLDVIVASAA